MCLCSLGLCLPFLCSSGSKGNQHSSPSRLTSTLQLGTSRRPLLVLGNVSSLLLVFLGRIFACKYLLLNLLAFSSFTSSQGESVQRFCVSIPALYLLLPLNWSQLCPAPETLSLQWPGRNHWWFICKSGTCLILLPYQNLCSLCHYPMLAPLYTMLYFRAKDTLLCSIYVLKPWIMLMQCIIYCLLLLSFNHRCVCLCVCVCGWVCVSTLWEVFLVTADLKIVRDK